jgi:mannose-6-phosphate isomerase-like protein (cupin superfamily)
MKPNQSSNLLINSIKIVNSDKDLYGDYHGLGISRIDFKYSSKNPKGIFIIENTFKEKGGPAKHLHYYQDEWFYIIQGNFIIEISDKRFSLKPGDSILAPRKLSHVWAYTGDTSIGKILITFTPAGLMEEFFTLVTKANAMPSQDPVVWKNHGMELLGPPLDLTS